MLVKLVSVNTNRIIVNQGEETPLFYKEKIMAFNLFNNTVVSDEVIKPILKKVFSLAKLKGSVIFVIARGKRGGGTATRCDLVKNRSLYRTKALKKNKKDVWIRTKKGMIEVNFSYHSKSDPMDVARNFCRLSLHEAGHVIDYQKGEDRDWSRKGRGGRRPEWATRPEEVRANWFERENIDKIPENLIIDLAIEIEEKFFSKSGAG